MLILFCESSLPQLNRITIINTSLGIFLRIFANFCIIFKNLTWVCVCVSINLRLLNDRKTIIIAIFRIQQKLAWKLNGGVLRKCKVNIQGYLNFYKVCFFSSSLCVHIYTRSNICISDSHFSSLFSFFCISTAFFLDSPSFEPRLLRNLYCFPRTRSVPLEHCFD